MGFIDWDFQLDGLLMDARDLAFARTYFAEKLGRFDPDWLASPSGYAGGLWRSSAVPVACQLIDLAVTLKHLAPQITQRSEPILGDYPLTV